MLLQALWLVGGRQKDADELLWRVPGVQNAGAVLVPQEPFAASYSQEMGIKDGAPSTGFVGEQTFATALRIAELVNGFSAAFKVWKALVKTADVSHE